MIMYLWIFTSIVVSFVYNDCVLQISNQDLLHAVVGLYDVCLSDMTPDCIYDTICEKWARTIVLVRDRQGIFSTRPRFVVEMIDQLMN